MILPGNLRELAEAQLGPLAMFELVDSPDHSLKAEKSPEDFLKAETGKLTDLSEVTTRGSPGHPAGPRRLVWVPDAQQINSPLMALYIKARQAARAWWREIDSGPQIRVPAFA